MKKFVILFAFACLAVLLVHTALAAQSSGVPGGTGSARIQVDSLYQDPDPAHAGQTVEVHLRIQNVGGEDASNFQIQALNSYPFSVSNDSDAPALQDMGTISTYDQGTNYVTVKFRLLIDKSVQDGQYNFNVQYRKNGEDWSTVKIPVDITSSNYAQILLDRSSLEPGQATPMNFTITNTGSAPIQNLVFSWSNPDGVILPVLSDDTKYVKFLDVGSSTNLGYTVMADVNANPGLYKLNLNLQYDTVTNATTNTVQTVAGIAVGGQTDFDVAFSESSAGQTSLSVANIGNNPALSVSVQVPNQQEYRVSGSPTAIIGNLNKGDYTIVSFQIASTAGNASNLTGTAARSGFNRTGAQAGAGLRNFTGNASQAASGLQVIVQYTDTTGQRQSVTKIVPIQFRAGGLTTATTGTAARSTSSSIFTNPIFLLVVAVVIIGGGWYWHKHSKKAAKR